MNLLFCEALVLDYAVTCDSAEGCSVVWAVIRKRLWDAGAEVSDLQLHQILEGMREELLIELCKWDNDRGFVDLSDYNRADFYSGQFIIRVTYAGRKHYDKLKTAFTQTAPPAARPIGFGPR